MVVAIQLRTVVVAVIEVVASYCVPRKQQLGCVALCCLYNGECANGNAWMQ